MLRFIKIGLILPVLFLSVLSCKKDPPPVVVVEEPETIYIAPNKTNNGYSASNEPHYILRNNALSLNKILLFIGGTNSEPDAYSIICKHAQKIGFDVISLSYPNTIPAASLAESSDINAFDKYRDEICFGNEISDAVTVNELNSIITRTTNLLIYLKQTYPAQNWEQYLIGETTPDWSKIVIAGHSQGSGHAGYIAKHLAVNRAVMFSGPNDYSTHFDAPAPWLSATSLTIIANYYVLLHADDQIVSYTQQVANIKAMAIIDEAESTTLMDDLTNPYSNKNAYHMSLFALSNHNGPIGANAKLPAFWSYCFGAN